jgi:hypothetical protein
MDFVDLLFFLVMAGTGFALIALSALLWLG